MQKISLNVLVTVALLIMENSALAATFGTPEAVPKNLHIYNFSGSTFVDLVSHECSGARYYLPQDHAQYDKLFSMLMAAQIANEKITLRVDGCNSNNQGRIIGVYLK